MHVYASNAAMTNSNKQTLKYYKFDNTALHVVQHNIHKIDYTGPLQYIHTKTGWCKI